MTPTEAAALKPHLDYNQYMHRGALQQAEYSKELLDLSNSNDPTIFKSDLSAYFNQLTDSFKVYLTTIS